MDRGPVRRPGRLDGRQRRRRVGHRAALRRGVDGDTVRLFAGCGIVADSDPEAELAEAQAKFVPVRDALGPALSRARDSCLTGLVPNRMAFAADAAAVCDQSVLLVSSRESPRKAPRFCST